MKTDVLCMSGLAASRPDARYTAELVPSLEPVRPLPARSSRDR